MALTVLHISDQIRAHQGLAGISLRQHLLQGLYNDVNNLDILLFIMTADIVGLKQSSLLLHHINGLGMILHIQPVTHIFTVPIHRQLLALQRIVDDQRNQLFRELVRAVVIGAVSDIGREMVGIHVGLYQHVRTGLTCGVRAVGIIGCGLIEKGIFIIRQRTVHLIRGHMQELFTLLESAVRQLPGLLGTVQHHRRPQHIGLDKDLGIADTAVHMALGSKMHDSVDIILRKDLANRFLVTDIGLYKGIVLPVLHIFQVLQIARIGQGIHVDDAYLIVILFKHVMNVVRADESGASGY